MIQAAITARRRTRIQDALRILALFGMSLQFGCKRANQTLYPFTSIASYKPGLYVYEAVVSVPPIEGPNLGYELGVRDKRFEHKTDVSQIDGVIQMEVTSNLGSVKYANRGGGGPKNSPPKGLAINFQGDDLGVVDAFFRNNLFYFESGDIVTIKIYSQKRFPPDSAELYFSQLKDSP